MKDEEILEKLHEFSEYLDVGNILTYLLRKLGWGCIQVLSFLVDGLEGITDSVLGVKSFFNSPEIQDFITKIQPFLYVLLAFSFLYIGYMLIIQKKVNREQIMINIFISMAVLLLLNTSMLKADKFTDQAIEAVDLNEKGTVSEKIIKSNITDVAQFDLTKWKSPELKEPNKVPQKNIMVIDITEKIDGKFEVSKGKSLSDKGKKIVENKAALTPDGKEGLVELDNGWFDFFPELYYRWSWNFWTIAISLFVIGMTLLFTSIKLAKLCYELGFNAILAQIVAPADVADGQKLKAVLKNILNTFLVTIMIFISMKVYLMGTVFISDKLEGIPYLIALIAFSIAVVDGPIMCERLFGIDAGLKSGWGALAGGFAMAKGLESGINMMGRTAKGGANLAKGIGGIGKGLGSGALQTAAGVGGLGKGLATQGNKEKQPALHEEMKKAGMAGEKGQNAGNDQKAQQQGLSSTEKQEGGKNTEGNSSEGKGAGQGSSLQDEMQAAGVSTDSQGSTSSVEGGNTSLHDEMQASGYSESANEGTGSSIEGGSASLHDEMQASGYAESAGEGTGSSVEGGSASLHDEMQASGYSESANEGTGSSVEGGSASLHDEMQASGYSESANEGTGSSVEGGSAPLHDEMQASGQSGGTNGGNSSVGKASTSLHDEMQASGQSGSANGGSSSVGKASAPLHDEMQASGHSGSTNGGSSSVGKASASLHDEMQASGQSGNTNGSSSSVGKASAPLHDEIRTSGYGGSTSEGGSSIGSVSTPVHEEIQTSGYGGSTSEDSPSVESVSYPTPTREPSTSMPTGMDQAQAQVAATQEPRQVKQPIEKDTVPASTEDIPMPHQHRTETRNIAQVVRDNAKESVGKVKERIDNSQTIHKTKRSYQIGRNTGRDLRNLGSKKRNKPDEK
ncbi:pLS20_p028 family conjugation system transmembrane protein [Priestia megaterium]